MHQPYLHIKNLVVNFKSFDGTREVLNIDEISIDKGEMYGIIGASGAGKTVLALTILRLLQMPPGLIASGEILLDGEDLLKKSDKQMREHVRGKKIAMIFQDPMSTLNPVFTVEHQLKAVIKENQGLKNEKAIEEEAIKTLELVKLPDPQMLINKYPHELSGGQRQRVIIALALCCKSNFIIADEPTRNLDVTIQAGILKLIKELQRELNVTVLFIANNPGLIYSVCDKAAVLQKGTILEKGTAAEVLKDPMHPYTKMLLNAIPKEKAARIDLTQFQSAEGLDIPAESCKFYDTCSQRGEACKTTQRFQYVGGTHYVRCRLYGKGDIS